MNYSAATYHPLFIFRRLRQDGSFSQGTRQNSGSDRRVPVRPNSDPRVPVIANFQPQGSRHFQILTPGYPSAPESSPGYPSSPKTRVPVTPGYPSPPNLAPRVPVIAEKLPRVPCESVRLRVAPRGIARRHVGDGQLYGTSIELPMLQSIRLTPLDALLGFEKVIESTS